MDAKTLKNLDVEQVAAALEADAGEALPDIRQALEEAKRGEYAAIHTPEDIKRRRGRPKGSVAEATKVPIKVRLDPDVVDALRATGKGWHTRINDTLRSNLETEGLL